MSQHKLDPLALYAGVTPTYPTISARSAPIYHAITCIFRKAEKTIDFLQAKKN
jgi:O-acetylhomoserine/O-acetylserine sulfhydrylase-like pyridoxal-dependent enzyme